MIPDDIINQVLDKADIVEIISGYMPLRRAGRNFRANCPFHHEKSPSFMVSPDKQIFHCFGCGEGGNVFGFLMKHERLEFPEAVELVANKVGVQIPKWQPARGEQVSLSARIYAVNELAANFYHNNLLNTERGRAAREYLKKRGIKDETIAKVRLGFASDEWNSFLTYADKKGYDSALLEKAGLVIAGKENSFYDRFRGRVIFPVVNHRAQFVAFGARVMDASLPKYINSPETLVYTKGNNLYGLNLAIEHIKEKDFIIIVEGYLDFLMPYQSGIGNIVASSGTALTVEQVRLIKRYTKNVTMVFDPDCAGEAASLRGLDVAVSEGMSVKVVTLPVGFDPDKFVSQKGPAAFTEKINKALDFFDYKLGLLSAKFSSKDIESKTKIANEMLFTIAKVPNAIAKTEYIKKLAESLDVDFQSLATELKKIKTDREDFARPQPAVSLPPEAKNICLNNAEKMLLGLALENPSFICKIQNYIKPDKNAQTNDFNVLFDLVCGWWETNKSINIAKLINSMKSDVQSKVLLDSYVAALEISDKDKCLQDCIKNVNKCTVEDRMKLLHDKIKTAQLAKDEQGLCTLLGEYNCLIKQKAGVSPVRKGGVSPVISNGVN